MYNFFEGYMYKGNFCLCIYYWRAFSAHRAIKANTKLTLRYCRSGETGGCL